VVACVNWSENHVVRPSIEPATSQTRVCLLVHHVHKEFNPTPRSSRTIQIVRLYRNFGYYMPRWGCGSGRARPNHLRAGAGLERAFPKRPFKLETL